MFFDNRLKLDLMTAFARYNNSFVDISRRRYNWLGEYTFSNENSVGEINKGNDMRMSYNMFHTRLNAVFRINNSHSLEFGNMYFYQRRKGSDPYGAINVNGEDVLKVPAIYNKNIAALGLVSHWLDRKVETIIELRIISSVLKDILRINIISPGNLTGIKMRQVTWRESAISLKTLF